MSYSNLTEDVMKVFAEISSIPRQSKHEDRIAAFLVFWAKERGIEVERDATNNVIMRVPATPGFESAPVIALQGHMDMVCEKRPTSTHDFAKDAIELVEKDGWLYGNETTLGADNGIGVAMSLAIAARSDVQHPALEIIITSDEETGMTGANALDGSKLKAKVLLNLDSEDEGVFTVGCAGGRETRSQLELEKCSIPAGYRKLNVVVAGLLGGHSGVDIHLGRASAIKLITRVLKSLIVIAPELLLVDIVGGSAHNAIARDAELVVAVPAIAMPQLREKLDAFQSIFRKEFRKVDPKITVSYEVGDIYGEAFSAISSQNLVNLLYVYPHGVSAYSQDVAGLVETSDNLAKIEIKDGVLHMLSSQRSNVPTRLDTLCEKVEACVELAGGKPVSSNGYPAWQPNMASDILTRCVDIFERMYDKKPVVEIIHAGLECGIIGAKVPGMEMISFGPTILSPHSPDERCELRTIPLVMAFLLELLASYKQ